MCGDYFKLLLLKSSFGNDHRKRELFILLKKTKKLIRLITGRGKRKKKKLASLLINIKAN